MVSGIPPGQNRAGFAIVRKCLAVNRYPLTGLGRTFREDAGWFIAVGSPVERTVSAAGSPTSYKRRTGLRSGGQMGPII